MREHLVGIAGARARASRRPARASAATSGRPSPRPRASNSSSDRLGRVVGELDGARRVGGHGVLTFLTAFGVCLMPSVCVQRRVGSPFGDGYPRPMDTHDTKSFPSDVIAADRGDSTAVMLAAESLGDASCPQPIYQHLVEAEVMEASRHVHGRQPPGGRGHVQEHRGVLVRGLPRARQRAPAHPAQRRPAAPPQVPQDPRPDLRAAPDGRASRTTSLPGSTTSSTSSRRVASATSPTSSRSSSRRRCSSGSWACRGRSSTRSSV